MESRGRFRLPPDNSEPTLLATILPIISSPWPLETCLDLCLNLVIPNAGRNNLFGLVVLEHASVMADSGKQSNIETGACSTGYLLHGRQESEEGNAGKV